MTDITNENNEGAAKRLPLLLLGLHIAATLPAFGAINAFVDRRDFSPLYPLIAAVVTVAPLIAAYRNARFSFIAGYACAWWAGPLLALMNPVFWGANAVGVWAIFRVPALFVWGGAIIALSVALHLKARAITSHRDRLSFWLGFLWPLIAVTAFALLKPRSYSPFK